MIDFLKQKEVGGFYLRNEFNFWNVHGIMNTWGLLQSKGFMLTLQETRVFMIHEHSKS